MFAGEIHRSWDIPQLWVSLRGVAELHQVGNWHAYAIAPWCFSKWEQARLQLSTARGDDAHLPTQSYELASWTAMTDCGRHTQGESVTRQGF